MARTPAATATKARGVTMAGQRAPRGPPAPGGIPSALGPVLSPDIPVVEGGVAAVAVGRAPAAGVDVARGVGRAAVGRAAVGVSVGSACGWVAVAVGCPVAVAAAGGVCVAVGVCVAGGVRVAAGSLVPVAVADTVGVTVPEAAGMAVGVS
jgi:hypothetical protein